MLSKPKRVAVIGAGIMGISALRRLSEDSNFQLVCFERNYDVGGLWLYTDQTKETDFGIPIGSAVYSNLRTNIPKQLMELRGFPTDGLPSFPTQREILAYINHVVDRCGIRKYIKFCTEVKEVKPLNPKANKTKWLVTYGDVRRKSDTHSEEFDAVIVGNGNCSTANYPEVEGEKLFSGHVIHSIRYRHPEFYEGQTVAVLGRSYSGIDIACDLSKFAKQVYLCHRGQLLTTKLPERITEKSSTFKRLTKSSVVLENGEDIPVDSVIYCTGYKYDFPFLPKDTIKVGKDNVVCNIYKSVIPADYTTLLFMGLPREVPFFPTSDYQAIFIRSVLDGTAKLPPADERADMISKGVSCAIDKETWLDWVIDLAVLSGTEAPLFGNALKQIWDTHFGRWLTDWPNCWSVTYKINGPDSFIVM